MRPAEFDSFVGQEHILRQQWFVNAVKTGNLPSMIFFGPPGIGKTTLATLIAASANLPQKSFSAVTSTIKEVREFIEQANKLYLHNGTRTIVFIDEIHRFNKAQQDSLLPWVEKGVIILLATTTENPSFYVNAPLLSRARVVNMNPLSEEQLTMILKRALADSELSRKNFRPSDELLEAVAAFAHYDARVALNALELLSDNYRPEMAVDEALKILSTARNPYDKLGDFHYNLISAFIKSMRGSDPDAAVYYLARMLEGGEDPYFILRRMIIFASEDIGNADPHAIMIATSAHYAFDVVGMPEGFIPISHAVCYLALAPKSNASYTAYLNAKEDVESAGPLTPPPDIMNPSTKIRKELGYGKNYRYPHDFEEGHAAGVAYLPDKLQGRSYYRPKSIGHEKILSERLERLKNRK